MESAGDDPIKRAGLISDIVRSISVIPDTIIRSVYTKECSRLMEIDEKILVSEINKLKQNELENSALSKNNSYSRPNNSRKTIGQNTGNAASPSASTPVTTPEGERETPPSPTLNELPAETHDTIYETAFENIVPKTLDNPLDKYERELIRYIIRYGYNDLFETEDINGTQRLMKVAEYIADDMKRDEIEFSNPLYKRIISIAAEQKESIAGILEQKQKEILEQQQRKLAETLEQKRREIPEMMLNKKAESDIQSKINKETAFLLRETASLYVERYFVSHPRPCHQPTGGRPGKRQIPAKQSTYEISESRNRNRTSLRPHTTSPFRAQGCNYIFTNKATEGKYQKSKFSKRHGTPSSTYGTKYSFV